MTLSGGSVWEDCSGWENIDDSTLTSDLRTSAIATECQKEPASCQTFRTQVISYKNIVRSHSETSALRPCLANIILNDNSSPISIDRTVLFISSLSLILIYSAESAGQSILRRMEIHGGENVYGTPAAAAAGRSVSLLGQFA